MVKFKMLSTPFPKNVMITVIIEKVANPATNAPVFGLVYENILGKNKESFFKVNFYKNNFKTIYNNLNDLTNSLNFYFYDFPFLLAFKSDSSRYL